MLVLVGLALLAVACQGGMEWTKGPVQQPNYDLSLDAASRASRAFEVIHRHRLEQEAILDPVIDPAETYLIGPKTSVIRSARGVLKSKLTSLNPNFAAVVVHYLKQLPLEPGDPVAVAVNGSFPAMNICVYAALEAMDLRTIPITSVSASGYGATDPDFTWLDMEALLLAEGVFSTRSVAASPGGENDMGRGLPPRGREKIWEAIERNGVRAIRTGSLEESIAQRMGIYHDQSGGQRIKTYINVGGGIASLGSAENKPFLNSGLLMDLPLMNFPRKGTMMRMADSGIPVVHLSRVQSIAREHGLAIEPVEMPEVGLGDVFLKIAYRVDLAVVLLIVYLGICCLALLPEVRRRVAPGERNRKR